MDRPAPSSLNLADPHARRAVERAIASAHLAGDLARANELTNMLVRFNVGALRAYEQRRRGYLRNE